MTESNNNRQLVSFFGAITASLSHEMKNSLATINEYSGLLEDLILAARDGRPLKTERLETVCSRISKQVQRSEALIARLNRFAHITDDPIATFALTQLLELFCDLCNRFAKLAQVTLERSFAEPSPSLTLDPFALLDALYVCLRAVLDEAAAGDTVTVSSRAEVQRSCCVISIIGQRELRSPETDRRQLVASLLPPFGSLSWPANDDPHRIDVAFTSRPIAGKIAASNTEEPLS